MILGERSARIGGGAAVPLCLATKYLGERSACIRGGAAVLVCPGPKYLGERSRKAGTYVGTGPKIWLGEIGGIWSFMPFDADDFGSLCTGLKCGFARALWRGSVDGAEPPTLDVGTGRGD